MNNKSSRPKSPKSKSPKKDHLKKTLRQSAFNNTNNSARLISKIKSNLIPISPPILHNFNNYIQKYVGNKHVIIKDDHLDIDKRFLLLKIIKAPRIGAFYSY